MVWSVGVSPEAGMDATPKMGGAPHSSRQKCCQRSERIQSPKTRASFDFDPPDVPRLELQRHVAQIIRAAEVDDLDVVDGSGGIELHHAAAPAADPRQIQPHLDLVGAAVLVAPDDQVLVAVPVARDGAEVALLALDGVARPLELAEQPEGIPGRTHPAVVVEERAVLRHRVPPMRHEPASARRHPVEVRRVHEAVPDVVVGRHVELLLRVTPHGLEHEARLETRREVRAHQVHVPLGDEELHVLELGELREPGALLGDVAGVGRRANRSRDARRGNAAARPGWRSAR